MAPEKRSPGGRRPAPEPDPKPSEKREKGPPIGYRPSAEVEECMNDYRRLKSEGGRHEHRPGKTAVLEAALRRYFKSLGYAISEDAPDDA